MVFGVFLFVLFFSKTFHPFDFIGKRYQILENVALRC